jgi:hypothetical protein
MEITASEVAAPGPLTPTPETCVHEFMKQHPMYVHPLCHNPTTTDKNDGSRMSMTAEAASYIHNPK